MALLSRGSASGGPPYRSGCPVQRKSAIMNAVRWRKSTHGRRPQPQEPEPLPESDPVLQFHAAVYGMDVSNPPPIIEALAAGQRAEAAAAARFDPETLAAARGGTAVALQVRPWSGFTPGAPCTTAVTFCAILIRCRGLILAAPGSRRPTGPTPGSWRCTAPQRPCQAPAVPQRLPATQHAHKPLPAPPRVHAGFAVRRPRPAARPRAQGGCCFV
jgi:hypothetical protein